MPTYGYEALNKMGKILKGSTEATSSDVAKAQLKQKGLVVLSITEQSTLTKDIKFDFSSKVKPRDMSVFCRQFVSVTKAGVSILECLNMMREQAENKKLARAIREVQAEVEKGETLSSAMQKQEKIFNNLMVTTIAAGENSGSLEVSMERMALQYEKSAKTQALLKKAMIYPTMVALAAVLVVIVMLAFVIPRFTDMFEQLGSDLPGITKAVVAASNFITGNWYILLPAVIAIGFAIRYFCKTPTGQEKVSSLQLKIPVLKNMVVKSSSSQMARTLATLLAAGVPLIEAVELSADVMQNTLFRDVMRNAREEISKGIPLSVPLRESGLFPPMVYHMLHIGEESGNMEEMLEKLADYYDEETELAIQSLMAVLEPAIILFLAIMVCILIAAVLAPIVQLYNALDTL